MKKFFSNFLGYSMLLVIAAVVIASYIGTFRECIHLFPSSDEEQQISDGCENCGREIDFITEACWAYDHVYCPECAETLDYFECQSCEFYFCDDEMYDENYCIYCVEDEQ